MSCERSQKAKEHDQSSVRRATGGGSLRVPDQRKRLKGAGRTQEARETLRGAGRTRAHTCGGWRERLRSAGGAL